MTTPVMTGLQRHVFVTYEAREDAFRRMAGELIPRRYGGPRLFWKDLREASGRGLRAVLKRPVAWITANPRDCLAFGSARQVLAAALLTANRHDDLAERIEALAGQFGIESNLGQPIRTLSGGETVKVALAKAAAMQAHVEQLVVASPFAWLSRDNLGYLEALTEQYARSGVPVEILMLDGEDSTLPADPADLPSGPVFQLRLAGIRTPLSPSFGVVGQPPSMAAVTDFSAFLRSPCLLVGANGQGKSLVAKILARAASFRGLAEILVEGRRADVRLLFQDVLTQTLLRDPSRGLGESGGGLTPEASALAAVMEDEFKRFRWQIGPEQSEDRVPALGRIKIVLAASRLGTRPGALILDEPDWGLSRTDAIAFVRAAIATAHRQQIAVILISHKPWWTGSAGSVVTVSRQKAGPQNDERIVFTIGLHAGESASSRLRV